MADKILDRLAQQREATLETLDALTESQMDQAVDDEWTVRDVLTHLLNAEEDHCRVIAVAVRGDMDSLPRTFNLDTHNQERLAARGALTLEDLRAALVAQRERTTALYHRIDAEQLDMPVPHPALGETTVGKIFRIIGLHEKMHLKQITDVLGA